MSYEIFLKKMLSSGKDLDFAEDPIPLIPFNSITPQLKESVNKKLIYSNELFLQIYDIIIELRMKQVIISDSFDGCNDDNVDSLTDKISSLNTQQPKQFKKEIMIRSQLFFSLSPAKNKSITFNSDRQLPSQISISPLDSINLSSFKSKNNELVYREKYKIYDKILNKMREINSNDPSIFFQTYVIKDQLCFGSAKLLGKIGSQKNLQSIQSKVSYLKHAIDEVKSNSQINSGIKSKIKQSKNQSKKHQLEKTKSVVQNDSIYSRQNKHSSKNLIGFEKSKSILKKEATFSQDRQRSALSLNKKEVRFGLTQKQIKNLSKVTKC